MKKKNTERESFDIKVMKFISNHISYIYALALVFSIIILYKLFDIRVNTAGDDSAYILRAYELLHKGTYPSWQGPLYPIILTPFILLFGVSVPLLKITSSIFLLLSFYLLFKALKYRVGDFLLIFTLFAISLNSYIIYYGYFTFSEAFYMFIQASLFLFLFKVISDKSNSRPRVLIIIGLLAYLLYMSRTIGIAGILAITFYFATQKNLRELGITIASFTGAYGLFTLIKKVIWGTGVAQFSGQLTTLLQKNPYNPAKGSEDIIGILGRLVDNSNLYISKHLYRFLSLRVPTAHTIEPVLTIALYLVLVVGFIYSIRKNKFLLFLFIYAGAFCMITFISLQKMWDQERLIVPIFPVITLLLAYSLISIFELRWTKKLRFVPYVFLTLVLVLVLRTSADKISQSHYVHSESLKGNQFFGFTPDWTNYLLMSEYAGKTTGDDVVACRKPTNSFIYGGKIFKGIYSVPINNIDSVFIPGKTYYAVMFNDKNANFFRRQMIKAIFSGDTESQNFESKKAYYLFELDQDISNKNMQSYKIDKLILEQSFSNLSIFSPDQLLNALKKDNTKYIILASLRKNPQKKDGKTIDTIRRYIQIISTKYPHFLSQIHEIGKDEKAYLYQINY